MAFRPLPYNSSTGVNGGAVTTFQGGLGCAAFDSITGPVTYAYPPTLPGELWIKISTDTGIPAYPEYTNTSMQNRAAAQARYYLYLTVNPGATLIIGRMQSAATNVASVGITSTGKLALFNAGGSQIAITVASVSLNQKVRVEFSAVAGAIGALVGRLYNSADSLTPTETISGVNTAGPVDIQKHRIGPVTGVATYVYYQNYLLTTDDGVLGPYVAPVGGHIWHLSRTGDNSTGDTWAHAFNEMGQIYWPVIAPGDTIEVDGGVKSCVESIYTYVGYRSWATHAIDRPGLNAGMLYNEELIVKNSGTALAGITIRKSRDTGRNGTVVMFGGRESLLPEANQLSYTPIGVGIIRGIDLTGIQYVTIDGDTLCGWQMYGYGGDVGVPGSKSALWEDTNTNFNNLINIEAFDCGTHQQYNRPSDGMLVWKSDGTALFPAGNGNVHDRCLFHDNGQDSVRGGRTGSNLKFLNCALYYSRFHSIYIGYSYPAGSQAIPDQNTQHVDGIQYYAGGLHTGPITIDHCWFGPGLSQGLYLGDALTPTSFDNSILSNSTIVGVYRHGIQMDVIDGTTPANNRIRNVTIHSPVVPYTGYVSGWQGVEVESGIGNTIVDSIVTWGGGFTTLSAFDVPNCSGNIYYGSSGVGDVIPGGTHVDPLFMLPLDPSNVSGTFDTYLALDLTPQTIVALGKGSPLPSFRSLMDRINILNGAGPTPIPSPSNVDDNYFRRSFFPEGFKRKYLSGVT